MNEGSGLFDATADLIWIKPRSCPAVIVSPKSHVDVRWQQSSFPNLNREVFTHKGLGCTSNKRVRAQCWPWLKAKISYRCFEGCARRWAKKLALVATDKMWRTAQIRIKVHSFHCCAVQMLYAALTGTLSDASNLTRPFVKAPINNLAVLEKEKKKNALCQQYSLYLQFTPPMCLPLLPEPCCPSVSLLPDTHTCTHTLTHTYTVRETCQTTPQQPSPRSMSYSNCILCVCVC